MSGCAERLASTSFIDHKHAAITDLHHEFATRQQYYDAFAQQGITFREFQKAYNDAYERGRSDMLAYRFSFFYAATAIAYHEIFSAEPEETSIFMKALPKAPEGCANHAELVQRCLAEINTLGDDDRAAADINDDGKIDILDVTCLQRYLAEFVTILGR